MTLQRWQEKRVLAGALERKPEERTIYLNQVCRGRVPLSEVESSIIVREECETSFMDQPAFEADALKGGFRVAKFSAN